MKLFGQVLAKVYLFSIFMQKAFELQICSYFEQGINVNIKKKSSL